MESTLTIHRPLRADAVANRERILGAARELFASRGANAEMRDIAERAGVGVGTLYRHFASRNALLAALLAQTHADTLVRMREAAATLDPRDAVRAVVGAMAASHATYGSLFEAMHEDDTLSGVAAGVAGGSACANSPPPQGFAGLRDVVTGVIERGIAAGVFRADADVPTTVAVLTTCACGPTGRGNGRDPAVAAAPLADFVLAALAPRP